MTTSNCAACAERLPAEARYCPSCGVAASQPASAATEVMPAYLQQRDAAPASASVSPDDDAHADETPSPELALLRRLWADRRRRRRRRRIIGAIGVVVVLILGGVFAWRYAAVPPSHVNAATPPAAMPPAAPPPAAESPVVAEPRTPVADAAPDATPRDAASAPDATPREASVPPGTGDPRDSGVVAGVRSVAAGTPAAAEPPNAPERPRRPRSTTPLPARDAASSASPGAAAPQTGRPNDEGPSVDGGAAIDWLLKDSPAGR